MAELTVDMRKLRHNIDYVAGFCEARDVELVAVVKGCHEFLPIIEVVQKAGVAFLGMSKLPIIQTISSQLTVPVLLTSMPRPDEAPQVVQFCAASLNSELRTIRALADAADQQMRAHEVILMVDIGDLREGVMPEDVVATVQRILDMGSAHLRFGGLGANLACANGTLPDQDNLTLMCDLALNVEKSLGHPVTRVSLGGSVMLDWLEDHATPHRITQLRIGEAILLGTIPPMDETHGTLHTDVLDFRAKIVEIKEKRSPLSPPRGGDAFRGVPICHTFGIRKRAILDFGLVDTDPTALMINDPGLQIVTSNSDYTVVDVTDCTRRLVVGDVVTFGLKYRSMTRCFLSPHLPVTVIGESRVS